MTTFVCVRRSAQKPLCYRPDCGKPGTVLRDYPVDRWGRTCDRHACADHSETVGWNRDYCSERAVITEGSHSR